VAGGEAAVAASTDPLIVLERALDPLRREMIKWHQDNVQSVEQRGGELIGRARFAVYGTFNTWPGLILSGSLNWSLLASKISVYRLASPRRSFAILLNVSPALTVYVLG